MKILGVLSSDDRLEQPLFSGGRLFRFCNPEFLKYLEFFFFFLLFDLKLNKLKRKMSKQKQHQVIFTLTSGLPPTKRLV